jgi:hypothetical protein
LEDGGNEILPNKPMQIIKEWTLQQKKDFPSLPLSY